ncbi:unnamed protein product, partial [Linum tenue]
MLRYKAMRKRYRVKMRRYSSGREVTNARYGNAATTRITRETSKEDGGISCHTKSEMSIYLLQCKMSKNLNEQYIDA